jgi:CxxC motif-containing protein (DUF1111 family)
MRRALIIIAGSSIALFGIGGALSSANGDVASAVRQAGRTHAIGSTLPGTDPATFDAALDAFSEVHDINAGLGPIFNERACSNCHTTPVIGGSGTQIEQRFGKVTNGLFFAYDSLEDNQGGSLRQLFTNGTFQNGTQTCTVALETEPHDANVRTGRRTTPLFGLGLVDSLPDVVFDGIAAVQPSSIRGIVQRVSVLLPDERDPTQAINSKRVGRFGLKGQVPSLTVFGADAYLNEMGITTQSCVKGTSVLSFAFENTPNNVTLPPACNGGDLVPANPAGDPQVPQFTDEAVGDCDGNRSELQGDVTFFRFFMERLAPPPISITDPVNFVRGAGIFVKDGCVGCHVPAFVTPSHPFNGVPGNMAFAPFSDFLGHDMGSLGDGIGISGDSVATTRIMRTAPLWGARFNTQFLHDGRAKTVRDAIIAHEGQGAAARDAFARERSGDQNALIIFINSI